MAPKFEELIQKARQASMEILHGPQEDRQGNTPGGFHTDTGGDRWYVKHHGSADHAHAEHLSNKIYRALGHNAPHSQILYTPSSRPVYFSKEIKHYHSLADMAMKHDPMYEHSGEEGNPWVGSPVHSAHKFLHGLAADALLGNTDLHDKNVGLVRGHVPTRLDNGASLMYHGDGERRNSKTGGREWKNGGEIGARDIATRWYGVHVGAIKLTGQTTTHVTSPEFLKPHVDKIVKLRDEHGGWRGFVNRHVPGAPEGFKQKATNILNYRTNKLINHVKGTERFD